MNEKRKYPRKECNFKVNFTFFEGSPDELDTSTSKGISGKGIILDISKGGVFIISNSRVSINVPVRLAFSSKSEKFNIEGLIVRTGLLKNNPSEVAQKFSGTKAKGDAYIAVKFDDPLEAIPV
ncbi:MAG: PilZ domain-containing protein [Spirochaetes bacterium]|nr:PilZ domain-containing protein [Spirochaetota bacterium]